MNPFSRAKDFVRNHKFSVSIGTGIVTGIILVKINGAFAPGIINRLNVTGEQLQHLLDNTESVIAFDISPKEKIWIINSATREVFS